MSTIREDLREHVRELDEETSHTEAGAIWCEVWLDLRKVILKATRGEISYQECVEGIAWALEIDLPDKPV
jgi:hypothetical protein